MLVDSTTPLVDSRVEELVLWTQNLNLLEGQGLWIQTIVLHCSCAKAASRLDKWAIKGTLHKEFPCLFSLEWIIQTTVRVCWDDARDQILDGTLSDQRLGRYLRMPQCPGNL